MTQPAADERPIASRAVDLVCRSVMVGNVPVLQVSGELDLASIPQFRDAVVRLIDQYAGVMAAVDLDGVSALDDTGLGVLLGAAGRARELGGDVVLVCTGERLLQRFERSGLSRAIDVRARITP
jgi:anti-sigma B factor antagonist